MSLSSRTIQKLMRETFSAGQPLVVDSDDRDNIAVQLTEMLGRIEGVDTKDHGYMREEEKPRFVCAFSLNDPDAYYYYRSHYSFRLLVDDRGRLTFRSSQDNSSAPVSDLEQVVNFVRQCKQRIDRQKALKARRGKIRDLQSQSIMAQVRKLAKERGFDFAFEPDPQKLNLYVKLSDHKSIVLHIPYKDFKELLPRLGPAIDNLRELYQSGIRFRIAGRRILPRRTSWITHESL